MIIVMKERAKDEEINKVEQYIKDCSMKPILLHGTNRQVFAAIGENRTVDLDHVRVMRGVEKAIRILTPYKLAGSMPGEGVNSVRINGSIIGDNKVKVIAGPCTVESREQILEIAHCVKEIGAVGLRGGAYKPRTSPYSFQGLEVEGLEYLKEASEETGLAVVTEVLSPEKVDLVSRYANVLQIGARNMQNYPLLEAVGETEKPVLLKRSMSSTLQEFLLAAEYILAKGNPNVILCERGIRTFEDHTRYTLPLSTIPFMKDNSHLPIIVDPSHGTGVREYVLPMSRAAIAAGADGLLLEVHTKPENSLVDAAQTISCKELENLMNDISNIAEAIGRDA